MLRKGGSVKFTVPREFSFNRFNGMRASLKTSELHRILERKIMQPVWFWAEIHASYTQYKKKTKKKQKKNTIRQSKREIFQIQCCVSKAVTCITVKFFFMVTDRDTFGHKDENYCAKEHGFVGDTHLPCIKRQVY